MDNKLIIYIIGISICEYCTRMSELITKVFPEATINKVNIVHFIKSFDVESVKKFIEKNNQVIVFYSLNEKMGYLSIKDEFSDYLTRNELRTKDIRDKVGV